MSGLAFYAVIFGLAFHAFAVLGLCLGPVSLQMVREAQARPLERMVVLAALLTTPLVIATHHLASTWPWLWLWLAIYTAANLVEGVLIRKHDSYFVWRFTQGATFRVWAFCSIWANTALLIAALVY